MLRKSFKKSVRAVHTNSWQNRNKPITVKPGYCKAKIFMALYNKAQPTYMGVLNHVEGNFDVEQAWQTLEENGDYLDYVNGRGMKLDFRDLDQERVLFSRRYDDRQQGPGSMQKRLDEMYATQTKCFDCTLCVCKTKTIRNKAIGEK